LRRLSTAAAGRAGASWLAAAAAALPVGEFAGHQDIGHPAAPGTAHYDAARQAYRVAGGGSNMWFGADAFHFVWRPLAGDVTLAAQVRWLTATGNPHRKACLLIRQGLAPDSAYADAVLHGDGLTALQCRAEPGGPTREIQSLLSAPRTLRLERQGDFFTMSVAREGESLQPAGGSFRLRLADPVYVGLGVCAHDDLALVEAEFSEVRLTNSPGRTMTNLVRESTLETISIASKDRRAIYHVRDHIEAPNWSRDGTYLLFNSRGRIYRLPSTGGTPTLIDTGTATRCNNDHGISFDGTELAISDQTQDGKSRIYVLPVAGGTPRLVTAQGPSYWHGWSPDGKTLVYCAERQGEFDVYAIPVAGGAETRLTHTQGLDDGPEFSPDGRFIYFNSERTGRMQLWRMRPDGSQPEQLTFDAFNNWFPHPSPDGKWIVFLSYEPDVQGHPPDQDVRLRLIPTGGGPIQVLACVFGGQGTINVPCWSPDSRQVAFVSYRPVAPK
jgi:sugar lactone lactonase YvrE